ncbi:MAG: hypothetical protein A4E19_06975 [Nitrospira sp. SG-bin1]|nr:MAG: hypothetical protein A4E19_06975 [Nitrospira sp. SG-bin1]
MRMVLRSMWTDELLAPFMENDVRELELNYAKGWKVQNLEFLNHLPNLLCLDLGHFTIEDISPIHVLHDLKALQIETYCKTKIDFSQFPKLEEVALEWRKGAESLFECSQLRKVFVNRLKAESLSVFKKLTSLTSLRVYNSSIKSIGTIVIPTLTTLEIANARKLASLKGIEGFPNLTRLVIEGCRAIRSIDPLSILKQLEVLTVANDGEIQSFKPLAGLKKLREVHFYESTNIEDGDLTPLKQVPGLVKVSFQERKHYNLKRKDFEL